MGCLYSLVAGLFWTLTLVDIIGHQVVAVSIYIYNIENEPARAIY